MASSRLHVERDPALALVVRIYIGSVAERWRVPEPVRDDLRLAASELFSGAVEAGRGDLVSFDLSTDGTRFELSTEEIDAQDPERPDLVGWTGRSDLIRALFPDAEIGDSVRIRVPTFP